MIFLMGIKISDEKKSEFGIGIEIDSDTDLDYDSDETLINKFKTFDTT